MFMHSYTLLQAHPDFSIFRFCKGIAGSVILELCFTGRQVGIYDLGVEQCHVLNLPGPAFLLDEDVEDLLATVIQVIELYTDKYPERTVRLRQTTRLQAALFRIIQGLYRNRLNTLFSITEERKPLHVFHRKGYSLLLKRKPDSPLKVHPVQMTLNTHSRLFDSAIHVRLCEGMRPISSG